MVVISECTSVINETMMNNNDNTITDIFIGLFSVVMFAVIICFCVFACFKWFKGKILFKNKYTDVCFAIDFVGIIKFKS